MGSKFRTPNIAKVNKDWKVVDDVSRKVVLASRSMFDYKGRLVEKGTEDKIHPAELPPRPVYEDPPLPFMRPDNQNYVFSEGAPAEATTAADKYANGDFNPNEVY